MNGSSYKKAIFFLSKRIRSEKETREYLSKKGIPFLEIDDIIEELIKLNYLNDQLFTQIWIKDRIAFKNYGRKQIIFELKRKGIDEGIISENIKKIFTEEVELQIAEKYLTKKNINPKNEKQKAYQVLGRKGFSSSVINFLIK